jgi:hypothetical protein
MVRASGGEVFWEAQKKAWVVRIQVGEEVMRRTCKNRDHEVGEDELRTLAIETARDEGYELPADRVVVKR